MKVLNVRLPCRQVEGLSWSNERPAEQLSAPLTLTPQQSCGRHLQRGGVGINQKSTYLSNKRVTCIL